MIFSTFYWLQKKNKSVSGAAPRPMDLSAVYSDVFSALERDGDFFGLVDAKGTTLQARYDAKQDVYWFEIPDAKKRGSYGAPLSFDDAVNVLKTLRPIFRVKDFPLFRFVKWGEDEVIVAPRKKPAAKKKKSAPAKRTKKKSPRRR